MKGRGYEASSSGNLLSEPIIFVIGCHVGRVGSARDQGSLCFGSLGLLASLIRGLLVLQFLIAEAGQSTGDLLHLVTG